MTHGPHTRSTRFPSAVPVIQYWHAERVPDYLERAFASFRDHNPGMRHRVFSEAEADAFIARHFTSRELAAFRACAVPAMQADYFRYCAVLVLGGVFSDADHRCVASLDTLLEGPGRGRLFGRSGGPVVSGFFAFTRPAHPLLRLALEIATANIEARVPGAVWRVTGPAVFSGLAFALEYESVAAFVSAAHTTHGGRLLPVAESLSRVVSERDEIVSAFEDVVVRPIDSCARWLAGTEDPMYYKTTSAHWTRWNGSIYRSHHPGAGAGRPSERDGTPRIGGGERERVADAYGAYRASRRKQRAWSSLNRGNAATRRALTDAILRAGGSRLDVTARSQGPILDAGCGSGWLLAALLRRGVAADRLHGVDVLAERLDAARKRISAEPTAPDGAAVSLCEADVRRLPYPDGCFDAVLLMLTLSSLANRDDVRRALVEARRVSRPGGVVVVYEPRHRSPNRRTVHVPPRLVAETLGRVEVEPITVWPPLARRLGSLTDTVYPVLSRMRAATSHAIAVHHTDDSTRSA